MQGSAYLPKAAAPAGLTPPPRLRRVGDFFEQTGKLGRGTYATVYKAREKATGRTVALKRAELEGGGVPASTVREFAALFSLAEEARAAGAANILSVEDVFNSSKDVVLVMEYVESSLEGILRANCEERQRHRAWPGGLGRERTACYTQQLLQGLAFCHDRRIVHRDLKPANVLITKAGVVKIADFGLARQFEYPMKETTPETVTLWYRAPELLLGLEDYTPRLDVWSVGCIMAECATGLTLFPSEGEFDALIQIFSLLGTPHDGLWTGVEQLKHFHPLFPKLRRADLAARFRQLCPLGLDLLEQLLQMDPERRPTPTVALQHPCFNALRQALHPPAATPVPASIRVADTIPSPVPSLPELIVLP